MEPNVEDFINRLNKDVTESSKAFVQSLVHLMFVVKQEYPTQEEADKTFSAAATGVFEAYLSSVTSIFLQTINQFVLTIDKMNKEEKK